jgi:subtilisin family serine protease
LISGLLFFGAPGRRYKNRTAPGAILLIAILLTCLWCGQAFANGKIAQRDRLLSEARDRGLARVIVRLSVPDIEAMTQASVAHRVRLPGRVRAMGAKDADERLEKGIASVASDALFGLATRGAKVKRIHKTIPFLAIDVSEEALLYLESLPEVLSVEENRAIPLPAPVEMQATDETDEAFRPMLAQSTTVVGADIAWSRGYTGDGWYVAVLDTGILRSHEFFSGKNIIEACFTANVGGATSLCPNGLAEQYGLDAAVHHPAVYGFTYDHGTHVAGIAAGRKPDGTLAGVARDADIIAVNVFTGFTDTATCDGDSYCLLAFESDLVQGLEYVYSLRDTYSIASVNMSLGGYGYSEQALCDAHAENVGLKDAIDNLRNVGIATIIASGNDYQCGKISSPGCISSAIAVGATDDFDQESAFSNWHRDMLDLFAPGQGICSSIGDGLYGCWSGTSMATPHVAGAWAVLKQQRPNASVTELWEALASMGPLVSSECAAPYEGVKPRIQLDEALLPAVVLPTVTITGIDLIASETGGDIGKVRVSRTGDVTEPLVVSIGMGGTAINGQDYVLLPGTVTIPVGSSAIKIKVKPIDDAIKEYTEKVRVKVKLSSEYEVGYPRKAIVTITDND